MSPIPIPGLCKGRAVYFYDGVSASESDPRLEPDAAIIAKVLDPVGGRCNLTRILANGSTLPWPDVPFSPEPKPGCWGWMPRV